MAKAMPFRHVIANRPRRSVFSNSYYKVFDCDLGQLIPVMCDLFLPGDHVRISIEQVIRANPLVAPIMHRIDVKTDYFFVPLRLLWPKPEYNDLDDDPMIGSTKPGIVPHTPDVSGSWEDFIRGGNSGKLELAQPVWAPINNNVHSLWDYFGFPVGIQPQGRQVKAWPKRAYNLVYNEYYRDPNLENPVDLDVEYVHLAKYEKDYFTSALPFPGIRGNTPTLPISGFASADFSLPLNSNSIFSRIRGDRNSGSGYLNDSQVWMGAVGDVGYVIPQNVNSMSLVGNPTRVDGYVGDQTNMLLSENNSIDLSNVGALTISQFREINAMQIFLERSMRAGSRYTEYLMAHWGVNNDDLRLMRPQYIGGVRNPVVVSEVLQTSETNVSNTPLGQMGGHGVAVDNTGVGSVYVKEHGVVIGIMRLMPKPVYQQGINRQWLYDDRFEYPTVEFSNLGEQEVLNMELLATANAAWNTGIFGFQGRYDEHRYKPNMVCGVMRSGVTDSLDFWHLARYFDPANPPALNKQFLDVVDDDRYKAVQALPGFIVTHGNRVRRVAPLPSIAVPRLLTR